MTIRTADRRSSRPCRGCGWALDRGPGVWTSIPPACSFLPPPERTRQSPHAPQRPAGARIRGSPSRELSDAAKQRLLEGSSWRMVRRPSTVSRMRAARAPITGFRVTLFEGRNRESSAHVRGGGLHRQPPDPGALRPLRTAACQLKRGRCRELTEAGGPRLLKALGDAKATPCGKPKLMAMCPKSPQRPYRGAAGQPLAEKCPRWGSRLRKSTRR